MLQELFNYPVEKGCLMAQEVDTTGRVILLTTTKEQAEAKRDEIQAFGADPLLPRSKSSMSAIIEPAGETANHQIQSKPNPQLRENLSHVPPLEGNIKSKKAFCPRCEGEMGRADLVCPHCGYDFPHRTPDDWLSSNLGRIALLIGIFGSGLGCLLTLAGIIILVAHGRLAEGLVGGLLILAPFLVMLIFLARVEKSLWV
jgi:hypothetical protein